MASSGRVLVAIVNRLEDLEIAREQHWYRIPVSSMRKHLRDHWPPQWLALYQTKVFGSEAYGVRYYARVIDIREVSRVDLFPDDQGPRRDGHYYQLRLAALDQLPQPILSRRRRRIVFIPTTWYKLINAVEINDLYDASPLEDCVWAALKRWDIAAERQEWVSVGQVDYQLDFAIYCMKGSLDLETDGDTWHANPIRSEADNRRDNALKTKGWEVLRFSTVQVREQVDDYCMPTVIHCVNQRGGLNEDGLIGRPINPVLPPGSKQLTLFEREEGLED